MPRRAKGGPRDALLSVRIPARIKYGLELVARLHREPMTDAVVRALDASLSSENGGLFVDLPGNEMSTYLLPKVWDESESVRLVKLALICPALLSRSEQIVWETVRDAQKFWAPPPARPAKPSNKGRRIEDLRADVLEAEWNSLVRSAQDS